jgi:hypothetical protein
MEDKISKDLIGEIKTITSPPGNYQDIVGFLESSIRYYAEYNGEFYKRQDD